MVKLKRFFKELFKSDEFRFYVVWMMFGIFINVFTDGFISYPLIGLWFLFWLYLQILYEWGFYQMCVGAVDEYRETKIPNKPGDKGYYE